MTPPEQTTQAPPPLLPLPCKKCGGTGLGITAFDGLYWVECFRPTCRVHGPEGKSWDEAVAAWNRRAPEPQAPEVSRCKPCRDGDHIACNQLSACKCECHATASAPAPSSGGIRAEPSPDELRQACAHAVANREVEAALRERLTDLCYTLDARYGKDSAADVGFGIYMGLYVASVRAEALERERDQAIEDYSTLAQHHARLTYELAAARQEHTTLIVELQQIVDNHLKYATSIDGVVGVIEAIRGLVEVNIDDHS